MLYRDHDHEGEREETQDLPDRKASGEALGEPFDRHIARGFPRRTNVGLRTRGQGLTRCARPRVARLGGSRDAGKVVRFGECHRDSLDLDKT
ncbi:hypothetical protein GCM10010372_52850 [Streptomyces tauricus]|nr:hypothetical protein GCM10010372_52850 [Streptomyces tauricus]